MESNRSRQQFLWRRSASAVSERPALSFHIRERRRQSRGQQLHRGHGQSTRENVVCRFVLADIRRDYAEIPVANVKRKCAGPADRTRTLPGLVAIVTGTCFSADDNGLSIFTHEGVGE